MLRNAAPIVSGAGRERARNVALRERSERQKRRIGEYRRAMLLRLDGTELFARFE